MREPAPGWGNLWVREQPDGRCHHIRSDRAHPCPRGRRERGRPPLQPLDRDLRDAVPAHVHRFPLGPTRARDRRRRRPRRRRRGGRGRDRVQPPQHSPVACERPRVARAADDAQQRRHPVPVGPRRPRRERARVVSVQQPALPDRGPIARAGWLLGGLVAVALGGIGIVVPGLPTTVFFIIAAWCFSLLCPRLERWVLHFFPVGACFRDHRAGLGMPRRAKLIAISMIVVFVTLSVVVFIGTWPLRLVVLALGAIGIAYIAFRVPTRERVLEQRARR